MILSPRRFVIIAGGIALSCLVLGSVGAARIKSPAQAAAETDPPPASTITAPVELRVLTSEIVTRGDVAFAEGVEVRVETGGLALPPVVTGRLPEAGADVEEGTVILEVTGRPVIALGGEFPTYRSLRPGLSGPDVLQLEQALDRLGHRPGRIDGRYDRATAAAVAALYQRVGYEAPVMDDTDGSRLEAGRERLRAARGAVASAEQALTAAAAGPSQSERLAARAEVEAAARAVDAARTAGNGAGLAAAEAQLAVAQARYDELVAPRDTSAEQAALAAARDELAGAETELGDAQAQAGTPLPAAEVVFLSGLPRRVDEVRVRTGALADSTVMTVSGSDLVVTATVTAAERQLLTDGRPGKLQRGSVQIDATVSAIRAALHSGDEEGLGEPGYEVVLTPGQLTADQVGLLRGANVRVVIPVGATDGAVLAVPLAALTWGPDGATRVEVARRGETEFIQVEVGLSAGGYAEIRPGQGRLDPGDQVVIGR
jgi:multidrug efflux pump subunit AcrA (membrane-fusion protein)